MELESKLFGVLSPAELPRSWRFVWKTNKFMKLGNFLWLCWCSAQSVIHIFETFDADAELHLVSHNPTYSAGKK